MKRREREAGEFDSVVIERRSARMVTPEDIERFALPKPASQKVPGRIQQSIRDSARDEECTVRIVGACVGGTDTTVWSHFPSLASDRGMGLKPVDLCGAYACRGCHDVVDGRAPLPAGASRLSVLLDWFMGHMRSLVRLKQKGLA